MSRMLLAGVVGSLLAFCPPAARADESDPEERVKALEKRVTDHKASRETDGLLQDLAEIEKAYAEVPEAKWKSRLATQAGLCLAGANDETVEKAAIRTLGKLAEPATWKYLAPFVRQPDPKTAPPLLIEALGAAGKLKAPSAVDALIGIVEKAKTYNTAVAAMQALSHYGDLKGVRAKILAALVATVRKEQPGVGTRPEDGQPTMRIRTGDEAQTRWEALSGPLVLACNTLTGQNYATPQDWFGVVDRYKSRLEKELFSSP